MIHEEGARSGGWGSDDCLQTDGTRPDIIELDVEQVRCYLERYLLVRCYCINTCTVDKRNKFMCRYTL